VAGEGYRCCRCSPATRWGDMRRKAVAIEPMTCPPNAFVTADDLLILERARRYPHLGVQAADRDALQDRRACRCRPGAGIAALDQRDELGASAQERPGALVTVAAR